MNVYNLEKNRQKILESLYDDALVYHRTLESRSFCADHGIWLAVDVYDADLKLRRFRFNHRLKQLGLHDGGGIRIPSYYLGQLRAHLIRRNTPGYYQW